MSGRKVSRSAKTGMGSRRSCLCLRGTGWIHSTVSGLTIGWVWAYICVQGRRMVRVDIRSQVMATHPRSRFNLQYMLGRNMPGRTHSLNILGGAAQYPRQRGLASRYSDGPINRVKSAHVTPTIFDYISGYDMKFRIAMPTTIQSCIFDQ